MVHRLLNLSDLTKTVGREMETTLHELDDSPELEKFIQLCRSQRISFEEGHDDLAQISSIPHVVAEEILPMIVVSAIAIDVSASEEVLKHFKNVDTSRTLHNRKTRLTLPSNLHYSIAIDRTAEAAFSVNEADDPLLDTWPFLLIVRTGRFVTAHVLTLVMGRDTNEYRRIHGFSSK